MQLFVGRIPNTVRYDELYDYFSKYGRIKELRLKDSYGFLSYEEGVVPAEKVLGEKHVIDGFNICVETTGDERDAEYGLRNRSPEYRQRMPKPYQEQTDGRYGRRGMQQSYDPEWSRKRYRTPFQDARRSPCDYCDRCERHGRYGRGGYRDRGDFFKRERKSVEYGGGYLSNRFKVVLDNIAENVMQHDLVDFARRYGLEPTFARITANGNHGIVEFSTFEEKEDALERLNGVEFMGQIVSSRPYFQRELGFGGEYRPRRFREDSEPKSTRLYDDIRGVEEIPKGQGAPL